MSGFAALVGPDLENLGDKAAARIGAALDRLVPDARTFRHVDGALLFGSLLAHELAHEHHAILPESQDHWLVGDISLHGREDLVEAIRAQGVAARTEMCDADLVVLAFKLWGESCIERLIGEYSFVIWMPAARYLFGARDHFGTQPFYLSQIGDRWIVTNAMAAAIAFQPGNRDLDPQAIGDFLAIGYAIEPEYTFFREVRQLPPAHCFSLRNGQMATRRYWRAPAPELTAPQLSPGDRIARFDQIFAQALRDRLRGPKIAISLSGGVDSTLVAAYAVREQPAGTSLSAYSLGYDWLIPDTERHHASVAAHHLGLPFQSISLDSDALNPPGGPWRLRAQPRFSLRYSGGHRLLTQALEDGHRIVLNGLGGDPLAAAHPSFWANLFFSGRWGGLAGALRAYRSKHGERPPLRNSLAARAGLRRHRPSIPPWLNPDFARRFDLAERLRAESNRFITVDPRLGMAELSYWSDLLVGVGPEGSGLPIRSTSPFFDVRLMSEALATPVSPYLINKDILRDLARPLLPPSITERRKRVLAADPIMAAARRGFEPGAGIVAATPSLEQFIDRDRFMQQANHVDRWMPFTYANEINRVASLAAWMRSFAKAQVYG